jgi:hypothetical protein
MAKKPLTKAKKAPQTVDISSLVPLPEAAELAGVREQWLRKLVQADRVRGIRIGKNYYVDRESAAAYQRHPSRGRPRTT